MAKQKQRGSRPTNNNHLELRSIKPLTQNQDRAFNSEAHMVMHGAPGTGKTFLSLYVALDDVLNHKLYHGVTIIRSCVPTRDVGFLPGKLEEKNSVYESPYKAICSELFTRGDAYEILSRYNTVNFLTTSFIRGQTIDNQVIIVDEFQNMSFHELDSIITRVGKNSRIIFSGDINQSDLRKSGLSPFLDVLKKTEEFEFIEFSVDDIVRSGLVAKYIKAKLKLGM